MNALILMTDIVEKAVLVMLIGMSIWSISIMIDRRRFLNSFLSDQGFAQIKSLILDRKITQQNLDSDHIYAKMFKTLKDYTVSFENAQSFEKGVSSFLKEERAKLDKGLNILATLGANAPFIGLFGTVLGIIRAFAYLGSQSGSTAVMTGVSQALYATAMGLLVAIPAVIAFNYYSNQIKKSYQKLESLRDLYISQLESK